MAHQTRESQAHKPNKLESTGLDRTGTPPQSGFLDVHSWLNPIQATLLLELFGDQPRRGIIKNKLKSNEHTVQSLPMPENTSNTNQPGAKVQNRQMSRGSNPGAQASWRRFHHGADAPSTCLRHKQTMAKRRASF